MIIHKEETRLHAPAFGPDHGKAGTYMDSEERVERILSHLEEAGFGDRVVEPRELDMSGVEAVHDRRLIDHIESSRELGEDEAVYPYVFPYRDDFCSPRTDLLEAGYYCFDVGTVMQRETFTAAKAAADTALEGAELLLEKEADRVFALSRPPGHHADREFYGGLCFFNNAAVAARRLADAGPVAVLDLDFHHGNGTQGIFYYDPDVLYVSIHGDPRRHFPFLSGHPDEIGAGPGEGLTMNLPLPPGVDLDAYRIRLDRALKRIRDFGPHALVVSMGFDTHSGDILGDAVFASEDFEALAGDLGTAGYPLLVCLEGGYDLETIGPNAVHFAQGLFA